MQDRYPGPKNFRFFFVKKKKIQKISKINYEHLILQDQSLSTFYLDSIDQDCMRHLTQSLCSSGLSNARTRGFNLNIPVESKDPYLLEEDYSATESGKRTANKEIDGSISQKRNK